MQPHASLRRYTFTLLAAVAFVVACSSSSDDRPTGAETPARTEPTAASSSAAKSDASDAGAQASPEACPTAVPGATIRAADVEGGAAVEVTTTGDVEAVRARARVMATQHESQAADHEAMPGHRSMHGSGGPHRGPMVHEGGPMMGRTTLHVEDIERGARIVFTPSDPADLEAVRSHVRHVAERMATGRCPAMM